MPENGGMQERRYYTTIEALGEKYERTKRQWAFGAEDCASHERWRKGAAERLSEIAGIGRCEEAPLQPKRLEAIAREGYRREKWTLQTEPGVVMPFLFLRPDVPNGAAVILPHGHGSGKEGVVREMDAPGGGEPGGRCLAALLIEAGYTVLCPDERGSGERREKGQQGDSPQKQAENSHRELLQAAIGFGQSLIGLAVWDLMRLVDFAERQPEIDRERIGCAGMSGGGQQTIWLAALDDRIHAAVTSGYFYGMKESLLLLAANCACNYVPHMWETMDMGDLGAMIAPRPLFIETGERDGLNGASGLMNVYPQVETARRAYRLYGAEEKLAHSVHPGGHQWNGSGVMEFFEKWLGQAAAGREFSERERG